MEGESPLFRRGGSLPPNLPLSPRTSPKSTRPYRAEIGFAFLARVLSGEVLLFRAGGNFQMVRLRARLVGGMRNDPCVIPFRLEVTCCRGLCLWWAEIYPPSSVAYATNCLQFSSPRGEAFLTPCKHGKYVFESWGVFTIRPHPPPAASPSPSKGKAMVRNTLIWTYFLKSRLVL